MTVRRRFLTDTISTGGAQLSVLVVSAFAALLAARWLPPASRGQLAVALAVPGMLGSISVLGVDTWLATRQRATTLRHDLGFGLRIGGTTGFALFALTAAVATAVDLPPLAVATAGAIALLRPLQVLGMGAATACDSVVRIAVSLLVGAAIHLVFAVGIAAIVGASVTGFLIANVFAGLTSVILLVRPLLALEDEEQTQTQTGTREVLRFGARVVSADAIQAANYRVDLLILAPLGGLRAVGWYTVAVSVAEVLFQIPNAASRAFMVRFRAGDMQSEVARKLSKLLLLGLFGAAALTVVVARLLLVPLLGAGYRPAVDMVIALLPGVVLLGACKPLAALVLARGNPGSNTRASAAGFAVGIMADLLLIPRLGGLGAAIASTLGYTTTALLLVHGARRSGA